MSYSGSINWDQLEWEDVRKGIKRKVVHGGGCTVTYNSAEPGHQTKPHSHPQEQVVYMIEGKADWTVDDRVYPTGPGSILVIPPNAMHFINNTGDKACIELDVFVPKRDDYVQSNPHARSGLNEA
jgi:quercetin dioxygenase-like cupin family protein